jgi:hypothetical protein
MSKVNVFVEAVDARFYSHPIIGGEDWYLCFDDEDPPEGVVRRLKNSTPAATRSYLYHKLEESGVKFKIVKQIQGTGSRLFPMDWKKPFPARSYEVAITAPIPIPMEHRGVIDNAPLGDCTLYAWSLPFPTRAIADLFRKNGKVNTYLVGWVTGQPHYMMNETDRRQKLRNLIVKQFPQARGLDPDLFEQTFGPDMRIKKNADERLRCHLGSQ